LRDSKPWKTYEQQLDILIARGLTVTDRPQALMCLERIGYYRLSGYLYSFRERSEICCPLGKQTQRKKPKQGEADCLVLDSYKSGATFKSAVDLYVFDKRLRLLMLDALERIEIALRVDISHTLGEKDRFAYLKPEYFFKKFTQELNSKTGLTKHQSWLSRHDQLINRSKEVFIHHNKEKYGLPVAIWVACEVWDFGTMSTLFAGMKQEDQDAIAGKYGVGNGRVFASWLRSLNYIRNVCAHHSRLWNRNVIDKPRLPSEGELSWMDTFRNDEHGKARPFLVFCIVLFLLQRINPSSSWGERMKIFLLDFPDLSHLELNLQGMGAPEGWEEWRLWKE